MSKDANKKRGELVDRVSTLRTKLAAEGEGQKNVKATNDEEYVEPIQSPGKKADDEAYISPVEQQRPPPPRAVIIEEKPRDGAVEERPPPPPRDTGNVIEETKPKPVLEERTSKPLPEPALPPKRVSIMPTRNWKHDFPNIYVAKWACKGSQHDELSFKRGEFIHVLNKLEEFESFKWWIGETKMGAVGLLPAEYVMQAYEIAT